MQNQGPPRAGLSFVRMAFSDWSHHTSPPKGEVESGLWPGEKPYAIAPLKG
jgi:hypothetical protein